MSEGQQQRAVILDSTGARPLNREERRKLDKEGVKPDEFINVKEWIKPEHSKKTVTRGEFMAILVHVHKQNRLRNRIRVALLDSRLVRWFLTALFGMKIEHAGEVATPPDEAEK